MLSDILSVRNRKEHASRTASTTNSRDRGHALPGESEKSLIAGQKPAMLNEPFDPHKIERAYAKEIAATESMKSSLRACSTATR